MISLRDVRKVYHTRHGNNLVLDGIGFDLRMGERLGILGRNGAGKSTMVRLVSGAELPTSGKIERRMSVSWPLAFGGAFQQTLTGLDNVRFISRIYDQDFERNLAFVEDFAELGPYLREPVRTYSSGMRARLAFAISMIIEFDCFLIDEIGAVGDARFHDRCNYELFERRSNRAMIIISHDPGYLRDHCNRFAVLNDAKLALYSDFEFAYAEFRERIGLAPKRVAESAPPTDRGKLIEASQYRAVQDERFRLLVREGDWRRDAADWSAAEERYAAALALYPYQRSYWVQLGHVAKEGELFERAEVFYRTACALGEPVQDVQEHLNFVMNELRADGTKWPIRSYEPGTPHEQVPAKPDADLFARMLWGVDSVGDAELLELLRCHRSCDELLAAMISDPRSGWTLSDGPGKSTAIEHVSEPEMESPSPPVVEATSGEEGVVERQSILNLCVIARPAFGEFDIAAVAGTIPSVKDAWPILLASHGFSDWPLSQAALRNSSELQLN